jgi:UDP-N-acetyl-D-glucosamine dehydrogenase
LDRKPDISFLVSACEIIGKNLQVDALVINESTSFPGTLRNIISKRINEISKKEHLYAVSPERVDPGNIDWKIENTPRLISGLTDEATRKARLFYESFCENIIEVSTPEVAEAAKLFENTFRQVNIALVNELALISNSFGISVREVLDAADTKPYGFMKFNPGLGVGGHCIPVDPSYLAFAARNSGSEAAFIELANKVNLKMPENIVKRIKLENHGALKGKKILVCGISYKPDVSDVRESPSIELISLLKAEGADVSWHDPVVATYDNRTSFAISDSKFDVTILAIRHKGMNLDLIANSAEYVFDCLGLIPSAVQL